MSPEQQVAGLETAVGTLDGRSKDQDHRRLHQSRGRFAGSGAGRPPYQGHWKSAPRRTRKSARLLTAEQQPKFDEMIAKMSQRGPRGGGGPGGPVVLAAKSRRKKPKQE